MSSRRVLCLDDNVSMQSSLKIGLGNYGLEVVTSSDGIDALKQYKEHAGDFGAILTDNDMPQMSGFEFVQSVREIGYKGRIVVMSGNLKPERLRAYQTYGISGFFHKPFEVSLLATMLLQHD